MSKPTLDETIRLLDIKLTKHEQLRRFGKGNSKSMDALIEQARTIASDYFNPATKKNK